MNDITDIILSNLISQCISALLCIISPVGIISYIKHKHERKLYQYLSSKMEEDIIIQIYFNQKYHNIPIKHSYKSLIYGIRKEITTSKLTEEKLLNIIEHKIFSSYYKEIVSALWENLSEYEYRGIEDKIIYRNIITTLKDIKFIRHSYKPIHREQIVFTKLGNKFLYSEK